MKSKNKESTPVSDISSEQNSLSQWNDIITEQGRISREKRTAAVNAIQDAEKEVPLSDEALDILNRIDHLRHLISLGMTSGVTDQRMANEVNIAIKDLRTWLNGLKETVPCKFVDAPATVILP